MNADPIELDIRFNTQMIANSILEAELALIETIMPDLILAMMQEDDLSHD